MDEKPYTRRQFLLATGAVSVAAFGVPLPLGAAAVSDYPKTVLAKKPVGYWRLGEEKGPTALDSTGHGHKGTYQGMPTFHQAGAIRGDKNGAIKLDGKRSYVEVANHTAFSQPTSGQGLTVEVWVRPGDFLSPGEIKG